MYCLLIKEEKTMGIIEQYGHGLVVPKDELTAVERDRLLSEGKEVDRIMCCIDTGETLAPMIGLKGLLLLVGAHACSRRVHI